MTVTIEEFVKRFANEFTEVQAGELTADTVFRNLDEWSSMQALIVIAMIDEEYGVILSADDMKEAQTVADIFSRITSKGQL